LVEGKEVVKTRQNAPAIKKKDALPLKPAQVKR